MTRFEHVIELVAELGNGGGLPEMRARSAGREPIERDSSVRLEGFGFEKGPDAGHDPGRFGFEIRDPVRPDSDPGFPTDPEDRVLDQAIAKISAGERPGAFSPDERMALYRVVIGGGLRPVFDVEDDSVLVPATEKKWAMIRDHRAQVDATLGSVARIDVGDEVAGTGFMVAPGLMMTAGHVVQAFDRGFPRAEFSRGGDGDEGSPQEIDARVVRDFSDQGIDAALVSVPTAAGRPVLPVSREPVPIQSTVYTVGYPASAECPSDRDYLESLFHNRFKVKRVAPGLVREIDPRALELEHDCSTLPGNSGSCVMHVGTGRVAGLHFKGECVERNVAVPLWQMAEALADYGVQLV